MSAPIKDLRAYFEDRILRIPITGCWLWTGSLEGSGYAVVQSSHAPERLIHRLAWHWFFGPIPKGMFVLHRCDVKSCVNPSHLFLGTLAENNADRKRKGRSAIGSRSGSTKLTEQDVLAIRFDKRSSRAIANEYNISHCAVLEIRHRRTWTHI